MYINMQYITQPPAHRSSQVDPKLYEAECYSSPCFGVNFARISNDQKRATFKDFRKLNYKWQMKLARVRRRSRKFTTFHQHPAGRGQPVAVHVCKRVGC